METMETMAAAPTIASYMEEELTVTLTRREVYYIRDWAKKRMAAATQRMSAINAKPAKRSQGREEYEFHQNLISRLYGVAPTEEEVTALREAEKARQAMEIRERAMKMKERADALMEEARSLVGA